MADYTSAYGTLAAGEAKAAHEALGAPVEADPNDPTEVFASRMARAVMVSVGILKRAGWSNNDAMQWASNSILSELLWRERVLFKKEHGLPLDTGTRNSFADDDQ